jgi:hypothetical protein
MRWTLNGNEKTVAKAGVFLSGALALGALLAGCGPRSSEHPTIQIKRLPQTGAGGPQQLDFIEGSVNGAQAGQKVVLYAHSGIWWVQPFEDQPDTRILPDGTWKNSTHLGTEYAAMLVDANYHPASKVNSLPALGNGVSAIAVKLGAPGPAIVDKKIHFSGYDWMVRTAGSDRGGVPNAYDPENARLDEKGFLHLRMQDRNGIWTCGEVNLTRSLGYGTYKFVVQDTTHLPPSAVVGLFTWDLNGAQDFRNEIDVELSQWGYPNTKNAQYVIQPFYNPANVYRFMTPAGAVAYSFRWEPGKVSFKAVQAARGEAGRVVSQHVFTSGIPVPASEDVHLNIYDFNHGKNPTQQPSEVVIEKFEFLP